MLNIIMLRIFCLSFFVLSSAYAMQEVAAPMVPTVVVRKDNRDLLLRSKSVPVMKASESIADLRTYMQQAQKDAEKLNNKFFSATGLDTDMEPLRSYDEPKVARAFKKAKQLLQEGAEINWGYPVVNLFLAFKLREESYAYHDHTSWDHRLVSSGYKPVKNPVMFGEGHAFLAWLVGNGADVNKAWPQDDTSRFTHYEDSYLKQADGSYKYKEWKSKTNVAHKALNVVPLAYAVKVCREGCCVSKLLQAGAKPYCGVLYDAFHSANPSSALLLIAKDASLDEKDNSGNTPAHWVVQTEFRTQEEQLAVLEALREREVLFTAGNAALRTPLHESLCGETITDYSSTYRADCLKQDTSAFQFLLDQPIDVNAQDKDGKTTLFEVVAKESRLYHVAKREIGRSNHCYGYSSKTEAQVLAELFEKNKLQDLYAQNTALVHMLVDKKADCSMAQKDGLTPLHVAAQRGMEDCVRILIVEGHAPVDAQDRDFLTPLQYAAVAKIPVAHKTMIIKYLMEGGANPEIADREGNTPLMNAALQGDTDGVELLLAFGANAQTTNLKTFTIKEAVKKAGNCYSKDRLLTLVKEYRKGTRKPHFMPVNKKQSEVVN